MKQYLFAILCFSFANHAVVCEGCNAPDQVGFCKVLYPHRTDARGNSCPDGGFGVLYNDYLSSPACYGTAQKAIAEMNSNEVCQQSDEIGSCKILYPHKTDDRGASCPDGGFGVLYNGYLSSQDCYRSARDAVAAMNCLAD